MPPVARSRGRSTLCRCSRCTATQPDGCWIPSQDATQHAQRDQRARHSQTVRRQAAELLHEDAVANSQRSPQSSDAQFPEPGQDGQSDIELDDIFEEDVTFQHGTQQDEGPSWLRMFMILVMWLACAKGLPRSCVDILLKFVADVVDGRADSVQPRVAATVKRRLGYDPKFTKFVICPDDGCQAVFHAGLAPPVCEHCSTPLFEGDGMTTPIRYFNFSSIINFLRDAFQHPTFEQRINLWRTRRSTGKIEDVTDGLAWREGGFTDNRLNLYLTLGLDWFVVFSSPNTASYTIGVISLRIENLPPHLRNRPEFLHVVAVLPGPKQCSEAGLSAAMEPLMQELRQLDVGVQIQTPGFPLARTMRARLLMAVGDLPARAKLAGFPSHSQAGEWCGHCHADSRTWVEAVLSSAPAARARDADEHRTAAYIVRADQTLRRATLQSKAATWTPLYLLPYWRSVRSVPVDAMHALHLGACKRFFHLTLIEGGLLQLDRRGELPVLADVLKSATYPRGVTRIRANFGLRSAGSPTADAWSTFTRYMLPAVLASHWADELASDSTATFTTTNAHLRSQGQPSFRTTVRIRDILVTSVDLCRVTHLAQRRSISADELDQMEASIDRHIKAMATMIDVRWPVPNHHALTHLPEHIRRFGPARCFWFYTQERLNGFLKKTMHNQKQSGELESTMQTNHEMYRCTRRALNGLDTSGPELVFRNIMEAHNVSLDNEEEDDELEHRAAMCPVPYLHGSDWEAALEPSTTRAIAAFINNTRTALDLVAVPVQEWDGSTPATLVGAEATFFQHIIVHGTNVTVRLARTNTPPGATFVLVRTTTDLRLAQVVSAFEHTYAQSQTGELVRRQYALVDVYRPIAWPASHPLGGPSAQSIGYLLCTTIDPYRTVTPLANILDACVTMTAKYITGNEDTLLAARLRP